MSDERKSSHPVHWGIYTALMIIMMTMPTCTQVSRLQSSIDGLRHDVQALKPKPTAEARANQ